MLINQFCAAVRAWAQKAEAEEQGISMRVAAYVGGPIVYAPETIEEMKKRLEMVVESIHMAEDFLIVSLIHAIERDFEDCSENYAKGIQRIRLANERILSRVPENLQASPQAQRERQEMERLATPSLEDLRQRRIVLDVWRQVTDPILQPENLDPLNW